MEKGRDTGSVLVSVCSQRSIGYLGLSRFWSQEHKQSVWLEKLDCTKPPDESISFHPMMIHLLMSFFSHLFINNNQWMELVILSPDIHGCTKSLEFPDQASPSIYFFFNTNS